MEAQSKIDCYVLTTVIPILLPQEAQHKDRLQLLVPKD